MIWIVPLLLILCGLMLAWHGAAMGSVLAGVEFISGVWLTILGIAVLGGLLMLVV